MARISAPFGTRPTPCPGKVIDAPLSDKPKAIVFDLDGTLIDSAAEIHAVATQLMTELGLRPFTLAETTRFIGHGVASLVHSCLDHRGVAPNDTRRGPAIDRFLEIYETEPAGQARLFKGAQHCLEGLHESGIPLGICTNKSHPIAVKVVQALDLNRLVSSVVGGGQTQALKPDPSMLDMSMSELCVSPAETLYVGDSEVDEATAKAAGVPFALYSAGYRKKPVNAFEASFAFDRYPDLLSWIRKL